MSLLVTGSIGIDTVQTPFGKSENCLGGSAVYFSMAASLFAPVRFIGVVGSDCPFDLKAVFDQRDVDLTGLEVRETSKTFRWKGSYYNSMDEAITDNVELNVLAEKPPIVPVDYKDSKYVFLANTAPALQIELLEQIHQPVFVAADTMNCWIENKLDDLLRLLKKINCLVLNEAEARILSGKDNLVVAAERILDMGPDVVIIKKGESGSIMCDKNGQIFVLLAYPSAKVTDPTGAGDSFAGGMMGYLAKSRKTDFETMKKAIAYGTVAASYTISDFSLEGIKSVSLDDITSRLEQLKSFTQF
ncbi:MAG: bifunctional hydroxymethylpyrimidine kinase/phosphomethylpyrimidine kinase [Phycisphaerae bacterium]|nr:bifunctional hydroxymethylpyrimidine kinase/phosphomethylpyrimidine kinase [Phycisphaerae bacterium]